MLELFAGLRSQITLLKEKLKKHNPSKNPKVYKEVLDALEAAEARYEKEKNKRKEKQQAKEQAAQEVEKEAINIPSATEVGAVSQNTPAPAATPGAPASTPDDQKVSCPLCGGMTFNDNASYQQHMAYTHASDIMPTNPGQKQDNLVASTETEAANKCAICGTQFNSFEEYQAHQAENHSKSPVLTSEVDKEAKFDLDAVVEPVRGAPGSKGRVMRHDSPKDLAYVMWESGPLKDRDGFGGYYSHDLKSAQQEKPIEAAPVEAPACEDCTGVRKIHRDLKSNYEGLLKDLKEERDTHYTQGNQKWVERLDQKIRDLEKSIEEKFGDIETKSCAICGNMKESAIPCDECGHTEKHNQPSDTGCTDPDHCAHATCSKPGCECDYTLKSTGKPHKESGAQNSEQLCIVDHTPARPNVTRDEGGKDTHDEFQDEWAMPAGIEMESAKGAPGSLFNVETAPHVVEQLQSFLNAPYINAQISTLGGEEHVSIMLTISADPKEKWTNDIMQNSRYGNFSIDNDGTVEQFSGGFSKFKQPNNAMRKTHVKDVQQLIDVLNKFLAKVNTPAAPATVPVDPMAPKTSALKEPVVQPTKLLVFKREFLATPLKEQEKFGGYEISQNGKKLFKINSKDSQPMSKEQIEFCAQIELTRGLKQAKLTEKVAFLAAGTKVYILAQDKAGKRIKFASMEHGLRGWAPMSKFTFLVKEGEMRKHKDHIDNTYGHNGKEMLVDCPNGSGNLVWLPINELLPIQAPPATPESLNEDLGKDSAKDCPDCHGNFTGAEGETCPTCGRFSVQKEALRPALPPQILNRRQEVNADLSKEAHIRHEDGKWVIYSHDYKKKLGTYDSKEAASKRLREIEYFKNASVRPFSKKADVLTDHITEVKNNIDQVQQRLQEVPAIKTADATTEVTEEETSTGNSLTPIPGVAPLPTVPTINNVQPTDNNNLEIPVPMPTSPPAPGQKWVYNDVDGVYVSMPDTTDPSKLV